MKAKTLLAVALACVIGAAHAEDATPTPDPELKKLQDQLALQTAKNEIMVARYGAAVTPKSGAVAGLEKLSGMANEHLPLATRRVGEAIGTELTNNGCSKTVLVSNVGISDKVGEAISYSKQIQQLEDEISAANGSPHKASYLIALPAAMAMIGGLVSVAGLFKSDYEVSGTALSVDQDWLVASMLIANSNVSAERFPDRTVVDQLVAKIEELKTNADKIPDKKKKKELTGKVTALQGALLKPDDKGMIPLVTTAFYQSMAGKDGKCLGIVTSTAASPMLLTKDTIWGKGGRAFLYMPVQASVVVITNLGTPVNMICRVSTVSAPIVLKKLTNVSGKPDIPWSGQLASAAGPCDGGQTPAPPPKIDIDPAILEGEEGKPTVKTVP